MQQLTTLLPLKKDSKNKILFFAILIMTLSCSTGQRKNRTLGEYLKDERVCSIKIESSVKDSFYVLPNFHEILIKMEKIKKSTGIWKYAPKRKLIIAYSSHRMDTLFTNGLVFQYGDLFFVHSDYLFEDLFEL